MKKIIEARARALAFDGEWQYGNGPRKNPLPGFAVIHQPGELARHLRTRLNKPFHVLYQPAFHPEEHLDHVCRLLIEAGECTLAIDELADYTNPNRTPELLSYITRCGRHPGISLVWTSQRPADISRRVTSLTPNLNVFRLEEGVDLAWLKGRGMRPEIQTQLSKLPARKYFAKNAAGEWCLHG